MTSSIDGTMLDFSRRQYSSIPERAFLRPQLDVGDLLDQRCEQLFRLGRGRVIESSGKRLPDGSDLVEATCLVALGQKR